MARRPPITFQDNRLLDPSVQGGLLDQIRSLHGTGFQQDVSFGDVYKNGAYDFSKYDAEVNAARSRGLKDITFRLFGTPTYQAKNQPGVATNLSANNPNAALSGKFAEAVAQHFAGRVDRYGVWNEPNVGSFLNRDVGHAAKDYELVYRAMRGAIKGVRPSAQVGFGEITSQQPDTPGYASTIGFLKAVLMGAKKPIKADYMSIHPYQWTDPTKKVGNAWYGGVSNLQAVQDELKKQAAAGKFVTSGGHQVPLVASEFGYKHDIQSNPLIRARWMNEALNEMQDAGVARVNLYQMLPSKPGDYWDSSILNAAGGIPTAMRRAITGR